MRERQSPPVAVRIATMLAVLVGFVGLYFLSAGPAYWICRDPSGGVSRVYVEAYRPMIALYQNGPAPLSQTIDRYLALWGMP